MIGHHQAASNSNLVEFSSKRAGARLVLPMARSRTPECAFRTASQSSWLKGAAPSVLLTPAATPVFYRTTKLGISRYVLGVRNGGPA